MAERRAARLRPVRIAACRATLEMRPDGTMLVRNPAPLAPYPARLGDSLDRWAAERPDAVWLAARDAAGAWQRISYREGRERVRRLASALLARGLSPERPLVILSGNGISHALIGMAAIYVGIPYAPVSPAYSLLASDFARLRAIVELLTPGLAFVADGAPFASAIAGALPPDLEIVAETNLPEGRLEHVAQKRKPVLRNNMRQNKEREPGFESIRTQRAPATSFEAFERSGADGAAVEAARAGVGPDTIAKFLFTSGSTGMPKAVINSQRMLMANCEQMTQHFAYLREEPPVVLDWAPWHHTAGGNHNFNLVLFNGGTFTIDEGKPTPAGIAATVRNLREVSPNWYFNVPKGYDALLPHLVADAELRRCFFRNVKLLWYAGAGMARHIWDEFDRLAVETTGERVTILTGLGATETAPFAIGADLSMSEAGLVGLPAAGLELKLVPAGDKLEARLRGPNVTPGYWRQPALTEAAFDEEGFYRLGDALRFVEPGNIARGFYFDGRIAEDFKLDTGTWVAVGPLRAALIDHCAPFIQDVVIAGADRASVAALIFPDIAACRRVATGAAADLAAIAADPGVRRHFAHQIAAFAGKATGSSNRITRALLLDEAPSIDSGEMTDKGSLNQRAVLKNRSGLVERLYAAEPDAQVICIGAGSAPGLP